MNKYLKTLITIFVLTFGFSNVSLAEETNIWAKPEIIKLELTPLIVPPKHEPTFFQGAGVARYDIRTEVRVEWGRLFYEVQVDLWGLQKWQQRGSYKDKQDWTVDTWEWDAIQNFGIQITDNIQWYNEYYITGEHLCCYHWLTGIKVKFK